MSRNAESRFAMNPTNIDMQRSTFNRNHSLKTSFNVGDIIPIFCDEVLPGDTFNVKTSKVVRMQSLITPMMDNMYLDTYFFFVPNRLVWSHWQEFCGENTTSPWVQQTQYQIPQLEAPASTGWIKGTIADYFGIPTGITDLSVNALPFRAYALICNEWFRDENLQNPLNIPVGDSTVTGVNTGTFVTDVAKGGLPYKACKFHDYFSSCLPYPQKGPDVLVPFGSTAPVFGNGSPMLIDALVGNSSVFTPTLSSLGTNPNSSSSNTVRVLDTTYTNHVGSILGTADLPNSATGSSYGINIASKDSLGLSPNSNVYADLSNATAASVNSLRLAFQIQKLYEKDARGGFLSQFDGLRVNKIAEKIWNAA